MGAQPVAEHLCTHGQQAGNEAVRVKEGLDEGESETEGSRALDYTSMLKLQVRKFGIKK